MAQNNSFVVIVLIMFWGDFSALQVAKVAKKFCPQCEEKGKKTSYSQNCLKGRVREGGGALFPLFFLT